MENWKEPGSNFTRHLAGLRNKAPNCGTKLPVTFESNKYQNEAINISLVRLPSLQRPKDGCRETKQQLKKQVNQPTEPTWPEGQPSCQTNPTPSQFNLPHIISPLDLHSQGSELSKIYTLRLLYPEMGSFENFLLAGGQMNTLRKIFGWKNQVQGQEGIVAISYNTF